MFAVIFWAGDVRQWGLWAVLAERDHALEEADKLRAAMPGLTVRVYEAIAF